MASGQNRDEWKVNGMGLEPVDFGGEYEVKKDTASVTPIVSLKAALYVISRMGLLVMQSDSYIYYISLQSGDSHNPASQHTNR